MKEAIWKIAPWGDFSFHGTKSPQLTLDLLQPDYEPLRQSLTEFFRHQGWVDIQSVLDYVASDQTDYYSGQVKNHALKPMEQSGQIEVDEATRKRRMSYPKGTQLRFI